MSKHYLYRHIRHDKNEPFYVGVGTIHEEKDHYKSWKQVYRRAFTKHNRTNYWKNIINKTTYDVEIMLESGDYNFILEKEREFIELYGRKDIKTGCLVNLSDGGEKGQKGRRFKMSEEQKLKISITKSIPIYTYDLEGNFLKEYPNVKTLAKELNLYNNSISTALDSRNHKVKGIRVLRYYKKELIENVDFMSKRLRRK
jgi:hypothetical protein